AAGGLPLLWRRRWPLAVFVVSSVAVLSYYHSHYPGGPSLLAPTLALATLTFLRGPVRAAIAGGALVVAVVTSVLTTGDVNGTFDPRLFGFTLWVAVTVAVATIGRMRRSNLAAARDRWAEEERRRAEEARLAIA